MDFSTLGGNLLGTIPFGDIVLYFTPLNLFLFAVMLGFTLLIAVSKTETQVEATFMKLGNTDVKVGSKEFKQRRFLSVICGIASAGAMITGDLFNFTLFMALIGIVNIGIVSAVRQVSVLNSAFNYGLIAMMCSLPLFGGAAIVLASSGTLSLLVLNQMHANPIIHKHQAIPETPPSPSKVKTGTPFAFLEIAYNKIPPPATAPPVNPVKKIP